MTPSITFQCPLSPAGTFQPVKSRPLNSDVPLAVGPWSVVRNSVTGVADDDGSFKPRSAAIVGAIWVAETRSTRTPLRIPRPDATKIESIEGSLLSAPWKPAGCGFSVTSGQIGRAS